MVATVDDDLEYTFETGFDAGCSWTDAYACLDHLYALVAQVLGHEDFTILTYYSDDGQPGPPR